MDKEKLYELINIIDKKCPNLTNMQIDIIYDCVITWGDKLNRPVYMKSWNEMSYDEQIEFISQCDTSDIIEIIYLCSEKLSNDKQYIINVSE